MKFVVSAGFGFALALSAFAFSAAPAAAIEAPALTAAVPGGVVNVREDWRERREEREREARERAERERRERCEHVRHRCGKRFGWDHHDFHRCVEREGCGR
jgi:hypothetical protein